MAGPCDLRAELQVCVDDGRQLVCDFGLCPESVDVLTLQWSGNAALPQQFQYGFCVTQVNQAHALPPCQPGPYTRFGKIIS